MYILVAFILLCVAVLILGVAISPKPYGWWSAALAVIALILFAVGGAHGYRW